MAIRGRKGCFDDDSCKCNHHHDCDTYSSSIIYDGENIEEAGIRSGMPLNTVIANLGSYVKRAVSISGAVKKQDFDGTSKVRLSTDPAEILQVTYCGGVLPPEYYKAEGRTIKFCKEFCKDDEFASVQVIYREKADSSYGFRC